MVRLPHLSSRLSMRIPAASPGTPVSSPRSKLTAFSGTARDFDELQAECTDLIRNLSILKEDDDTRRTRLAEAATNQTKPGHRVALDLVKKIKKTILEIQKIFAGDYDGTLALCSSIKGDILELEILTLEFRLRCGDTPAGGIWASAHNSAMNLNGANTKMTFLSAPPPGTQQRIGQEKASAVNPGMDKTAETQAGRADRSHAGNVAASVSSPRGKLTPAARRKTLHREASLEMPRILQGVHARAAGGALSVSGFATDSASDPASGCAADTVRPVAGIDVAAGDCATISRAAATGGVIASTGDLTPRHAGAPMSPRVPRLAIPTRARDESAEKLSQRTQMLDNDFSLSQKLVELVANTSIGYSAVRTTLVKSFKSIKEALELLLVPAASQAKQLQVRLLIDLTRGAWAAIDEALDKKHPEEAANHIKRYFDTYLHVLDIMADKELFALGRNAAAALTDATVQVFEVSKSVSVLQYPQDESSSITDAVMLPALPPTPDALTLSPPVSPRRPEPENERRPLFRWASFDETEHQRFTSLLETELARLDAPRSPSSLAPQRDDGTTRTMVAEPSLADSVEMILSAARPAEPLPPKAPKSTLLSSPALTSKSPPPLNSPPSPKSPSSPDSPLSPTRAGGGRKRVAPTQLGPANAKSRHTDRHDSPGASMRSPVAPLPGIDENIGRDRATPLEPIDRERQDINVTPWQSGTREDNGVLAMEREENPEQGLSPRTRQPAGTTDATTSPVRSPERQKRWRARSEGQRSRGEKALSLRLFRSPDRNVG